MLDKEFANDPEGRARCEQFVEERQNAKNSRGRNSRDNQRALESFASKAFEALSESDDREVPKIWRDVTRESIRDLDSQAEDVTASELLKDYKCRLLYALGVQQKREALNLVVDLDEKSADDESGSVSEGRSVAGHGGARAGMQTDDEMIL